MEQYFRVSTEWMKTYPHGTMYDEPKVFEVLYVKKTQHQCADIVVLKSEHTANGEWLVLSERGHFVGPFTLMLAEGLFMPVLADTEPYGTDVLSRAEFDSFDEAHAAALRFNDAIRKAFIDSIPKAKIDDLPSGAFCRRLGKDGMPMAKTYRRELFDNHIQRYPIVDPFNPSKVIQLVPGTLVAVDV